MVFIFGSILSSAALVILFKVFERYGINVFQAILFNYLTAALIAFACSNQTTELASISTPFWISMLVIGLFFIAIFNLIGYSVSKVGIAAVSVSQKMSLIIPVLYGMLFLGEVTGSAKLIGLIIALIAIYLSTKQQNSPSTKFNKEALLLPLLIFTGSGIVDSIIKYTQANFIRPENEQLFISGTYGACSLAGLVVFGYLLYLKKTVFAWKNVLAGIVLGIPNYFSMLFFVKALALPWLPVSVFFPINNLGIIITSTLTARFVFKEQIIRLQVIGIGLAIIAIVLIAL